MGHGKRVPWFGTCLREAQSEQALVGNPCRHSASVRHIVSATAGSLTVGAPALIAPRFQA
jgi:hypothetical protein